MLTRSGRRPTTPQPTKKLPVIKKKTNFIANTTKSAETSHNELTPFLSLPDHIKVKILSFSDFKTMMNATETCTELNSFVFSETKLAERVKLKGALKDVAERWKATQRVHRNLEIYEPHNRGITESDGRIMLSLFKSEGSFLKEFSVDKTVDLDITQMLKHSVNLEKLRIRGAIFDGSFHDRPLNMPKLKVLDINSTLIPVIKFSSNVRSLESISVSPDMCYGEKYHNDDKAAAHFEDFILKQVNLKTLVLRFNIQRGFFPEEKLKEAKFKLEKFKSIMRFPLMKSPKMFLKMQCSTLRELEIYDSMGFDISLLSKLELLKLGKKPDWNDLLVRGIQNLSVKTVYLGTYIASDNDNDEYTSQDLEKVFKVLPNLKAVYVESYATSTTNFRRFTLLFTVSSAHLKTLRLEEGFHTGRCMRAARNLIFHFKPVEPSVDLVKDAANIVTFLKNHPRSIRSIKIEIKASPDVGSEFPASFEKYARNSVHYNKAPIEVKVIPTVAELQDKNAAKRFKRV